MYDKPKMGGEFGLEVLEIDGFAVQFDAACNFKDVAGESLDVD